MNERRLVSIPNGPAPAPSVAGMIPSGRVRGAGTVSIPTIRLQAQAPNGMKRVGGVLVDGQQLAQGAMGEARAAQVAGGAVQRAFTDVADSAVGHLQRVIFAREKAELEWAHAQMTTAFDTYKAGLPEDPSDWQEGWGDKAQEIKDQLLGGDKKLSSALRARIEEDFTKWDNGSRGRLSSMAITQNAQIAKAKFSMVISQHKENEDIAGVESAVASAIHAGVMAPELGALTIQNARREIGHKQTMREGYNNPFEAEAALKEGKLDWMSPGDKFQFQKMVEGRKDEVRRDEFDNALNWTLNNRELPEEQWKSGVSMFAPHLEATAIEDLNKHRLGTMKPDPEKTNKFADEAVAFTPHATPAQQANFEWRANRELDVISARNVIHLMRSASAPDTDPESPAKKAFAADISRGNSIINGTSTDFNAVATKEAPRSYWFRENPYKAFLSEDGKTVDKAKLAAAELQARDRFKSWLQTHQDASQAEKDTEAAKLRILPPIMDEKTTRIEADTSALFKRPGRADLSPWLGSYLEQGGAYSAAITYP